MEDEPVTVVDAEGDYVAIAQQVLQNLGAVYEDAGAIATVLQPVAGAVRHDRRAAAGDAPVVKLQSVVDLTASPDVEGLKSQGNLLAGTVRGYDFQYGFVLRGMIAHGIRCGQIVTFSIDKTWGRWTDRRVKCAALLVRTSIVRAISEWLLQFGSASAKRSGTTAFAWVFSDQFYPGENWLAEP
jgi:hypothetical protein